MDDLIGEFITETSESLAVLDAELGKLERNPNDQAVLGNIFRLVHTIKGTCGFLGLPRLESVAHAGEKVLGKIRDGAITVTPEATGIVLEALDAIKTLIAHLAEHGVEPQGSDDALKRRLNAFADSNGTSTVVAPPTLVVPAPVVVEEDLPAAEEEAMERAFANAQAAPAPAAEPLLATPEPMAVPAVPVISEKAKETAIAQGLDTPEKTQAAPAVAPAALRQLMDMVGELVTTRNQIAQIVRQRDDQMLQTPLKQLSQIATALQKGVMALSPTPFHSSIQSVLLVSAGDYRFALAQKDVVEMVQLGPTFGHGVETINHAPVLRLHGALLPLMSLRAALQLPEASQAASHAVVLRHAGTEFGLLVDRVENLEEIVVKPASRALGKLAVYAGTTILGDGSVVMILDAHGLVQMLGDVDTGEAAEAVPADLPETHFLVFRAGAGAPKAVPLDHVSRLEQIDAAMVDLTGPYPTVSYHNSRMRLEVLPGMAMPTEGKFHTVVFKHEGRAIGLVVEKILDIDHGPLVLTRVSKQHQYLGSMVMKGQSTDIVDAGYLLRSIARTASELARVRLLFVENSDASRTLPMLRDAGYDVTAAHGSAEALAAMEQETFDAVVSDEMDGFELTRRLRADARYQDMPIIALSDTADAYQRAQGAEIGYSSMVRKDDNAALVETIAQHVAPKEAA